MVVRFLSFLVISSMSKPVYRVVKEVSPLITKKSVSKFLSMDKGNVGVTHLLSGRDTASSETNHAVRNTLHRKSREFFFNSFFNVILCHLD